MNAVADTAEFILNRVSRGYHIEPLRILAADVAGVDEVDIDVDLAVTRNVWDQLGQPACLTPRARYRLLEVV